MGGRPFFTWRRTAPSYVKKDGVRWETHALLGFLLRGSRAPRNEDEVSITSSFAFCAPLPRFI